MRRNIVSVFGGFVVLVLAAGPILAVDWTLDGNGSWINDGNWSGTHPNGVGAVADFSTIDITANRTITFDAPITVGTMTVGDSSGSSRYTFSQGSGSLTFDGGGTSVLSCVSGSRTYFPAVVLSDMLIVNGNSYGVDMNAGISGSGGLTVNSGFFSMRDGGGSYTGQTIVNSNSTLQIRSNLPSGAFVVNDNGVIAGYFTFSLTKSLGTGSGSIRFTGGPGTTSGFSWNNSMTVKFNNNSSTVVQWGGGDFDMETLLFKNQGTLAVCTFDNILDLNGGDRSIEVVTTTNTTVQYVKLNQEVQDTAGGASLTKTGNGRLVLEAVNTFEGDIIVSEGMLELAQINASNEGSSVTIETGATLTLSYAGDDTVNWLFTGNTKHYAGEYGHTDSGADNGGLGVGALDAYFGAGSGKLIVTGQPAGTVVVIE